MPSPFPRPAGPGTVPADRLRELDELRAAVRGWADHLPETRPYVDLLFAFGAATLGDPVRAGRLVAAAEAEPLILGKPPKAKEPGELTVAAPVRDWLFRAFRYRIGEALAGRPHTGRLPVDVLAARAAIERETQSESLPRAALVLYVIDRFRTDSRTLEPLDRVDPYGMFVQASDELSRELRAIAEAQSPEEFASRTRRLLREGVRGRPRTEDRATVVRRTLDTASRVNDGLAGELVGDAVELLTAPDTDANRETPRQRADLLERSMSVAVNLGRADLVRELARCLPVAVRRRPPPERLRLITAAGPACLCGLRVFGLRGELVGLATQLDAEVAEVSPPAGPRPQSSLWAEWQVSSLQARATVAGLILALGREPGGALDEARDVLLRPGGRRGTGIDPREFVTLARAYVSALGQGPAASGGPRVAQLFREMDPASVPAAWTTCPYFSRDHVVLAEEAVAAVCRMALEPPLTTGEPGV